MKKIKQYKVTKWMMVTAIMLMNLLCGMEFDLFAPSFAQIQNHFNLTSFMVVSLLPINFIGYFISLFVVGTLADRYGRKMIILSGLFIFVLGSLLCLHQQIFYYLLLGRFLQGTGIAAPAILSILIIADTYDIKEQRFLMTLLNGIMNVAIAIAPIIGSYITLHFNWRGNFTVLLVLGLITFITSIFFIPNHKLPIHQQDAIPHGYLPIVKSTPLMLVIIMLLVNYVPYWVFVGLSPLLYVKDLGVTLNHFGLYQGSLALTFGIGSIIYSLILKKKDHPQKIMLKTGNAIFSISFICIVALILTNTTSALLITLSMILFVIAQIIPGAILTPLALNFKPNAKARVSALLQAGRLLLSAFSIQTAGLFYTGHFRPIGIIIGIYLFSTIILLTVVIRNKQLMSNSN